MSKRCSRWASKGKRTSALQAPKGIVNALVAHYHEVGLKGRNRDFFEGTLARNLKRAMRGTGYRRVRRGFGRIVTDFYKDNAMNVAAERAARVFGVAYIGAGVRVEPDMDAIARASLGLIEGKRFDSFAMRARRTYSTFPSSSRDINTVVGQTVKDATGARVDLGHPDLTVWVELFANSGIVYVDRLQGAGGLPTGTSGRMIALLSGGIDSPVAAWRLMRRGAEVELLHFHGRPYTDASSTHQASELTERLTRWQLRTTLHLVPLADAQREIVAAAPSSLRVILYRRAMFRIAAALARQREASALVTGDSLGQVASQTIENLNAVDEAVFGTQVLRPLVGLDKLEIVDSAQQIDTYDISTRKYQDCCVLFEPRAPATKATVDEVLAAEERIDVETMVGKALAGIETRVLELPESEPANPAS
jgi:tRNA uracil 4-sulfurtransferase